MTKPLIAISTLINEGYRLAKQSWILTFWHGLGIVLTSTLATIVPLIPGFNSNTWIALGIRIPIYILMIWFVVSLLDLLLAIDRKEKPISRFTLTPSVFVRFILTNIVRSIATVIGLILFIAPGIAIATYFSMSTFFVIEDKMTIKQGLLASINLVKGRFWATWARLVLPSFLIIGLLYFIVCVTTFILALFAAAFTALSVIVTQSTASYLAPVSIFGVSLLGIFGLVLFTLASMMATLWIYCVYVKLFHSLKATAVKSTNS